MRELADEQDYVNVLYVRLDALREEAAAALVVIADPAAILAADPVRAQRSVRGADAGHRAAGRGPSRAGATRTE